jgi:YggT family protein
MFVLRHLVEALIPVLDIVFTAAYWMIILRAIISWVNPDPYNPLVQFLYKATEPMLAPFRRIIPSHSIGVDVSPIFAIIVIFFLQRFLIPTLYDIAAMIR